MDNASIISDARHSTPTVRLIDLSKLASPHVSTYTWNSGTKHAIQVWNDIRTYGLMLWYVMVLIQIVQD